MGYNNLIDSSNFINKILEIYELSYIYNIPLNKIDFLVSREAYVHSIVHYKDNTLSINAFKNDMIITLIKPLNYFFSIKTMPLKQSYLESNNLIIEKPFEEYHTYSMQWAPDKIQFFIDDEMHFEFPMQSQHSPFDKPFFLLLNLAVGGHWTDGYVAPGFTEATYEIDYVRVYQ